MIVKSCGITNEQDAIYALESSADWIGVNLVAGPRRISLASALRILSHLDDSSGVESLPGRKDHVKIKAFFAAVRGVADEGERSAG